MAISNIYQLGVSLMDKCQRLLQNGRMADYTPCLKKTKPNCYVINILCLIISY